VIDATTANTTVAVLGADRVNANKDPRDGDSPDREIPCVVVTMKSVERAMVGVAPARTFSWQDIRSPTRITAPGPLHMSVESDVGRPYTFKFKGLFVIAFAPRVKRTLITNPLVVAVSGAERVNVNEEPPLLGTRSEMSVPPVDVGAMKSPETPVVPTAKFLAVIVHVTSSPIRSWLVGPMQDRIEVLEGCP
jgi:hypothetical protein